MFTVDPLANMNFDRSWTNFKILKKLKGISSYVVESCVVNICLFNHVIDFVNFLEENEWG